MLCTVAAENVRASREKSGNQRLANLPTCYYKYVYVILCIQSCPILCGINILSSKVQCICPILNIVFFYLKSIKTLCYITDKRYRSSQYSTCKPFELSLLLTALHCPPEKTKKQLGKLTLIFQQCCGPGSGVRGLFDPWIRDPGWVKNQDPDLGSGMNIPVHISKSLETIFWIKNA